MYQGAPYVGWKNNCLGLFRDCGLAHNFFQFLTWFCKFSTLLPIIICYNWHFSYVRSEKRPVINKLKKKSVLKTDLLLFE